MQPCLKNLLHNYYYFFDNVCVFFTYHNSGITQIELFLFKQVLRRRMQLNVK